MASNQDGSPPKKKKRFINSQHYRKRLPASCIPFSSDEGKNIFREALAAGFMEGYFRLAAQFRTQEEPLFCGITTMTMVLNALEVDPGRTWKGVFRWYHEKMLDCGPCCGNNYEHWEQKGITFDEWKNLATCNGLEILQAVRGDEAGSEDALRTAVKKSCSSVSDSVVVVSYDRRGLGQAGSGHFSPVGGYHPERDLVLVLDVARFKYPPHWVKLSTLHAACAALDKVTKQSRGFLTMKKSDATLIMFRLNTNQRHRFVLAFKMFSARLQQNLSRTCSPTPDQDCASCGSTQPCTEIQPCMCAKMLVSTYLTSFSPSERSLIVNCATPFAKRSEEGIFDFHGYAIESVSRKNRKMISQLVTELEATRIFVLVKDNLNKLGLLRHSKTTSDEECPCGGTSGTAANASAHSSPANSAKLDCGLGYSLSVVHLMVVFLLLWINQQGALHSIPALCSKSIRSLFPAFCTNDWGNQFSTNTRKIESSAAMPVPMHPETKTREPGLLEQEIRTLLIQLQSMAEFESCSSSSLHCVL